MKKLYDFQSTKGTTQTFRIDRPIQDLVFINKMQEDQALIDAEQALNCIAIKAVLNLPTEQGIVILDEALLTGYAELSAALGALSVSGETMHKHVVKLTKNGNIKLSDNAFIDVTIISKIASVVVEVYGQESNYTSKEFLNYDVDTLLKSSLKRYPVSEKIAILLNKGMSDLNLRLQNGNVENLNVEVVELEKSSKFAFLKDELGNKVQDGSNFLLLPMIYDGVNVNEIEMDVKSETSMLSVSAKKYLS